MRRIWALFVCSFLAGCVASAPSSLPLPDRPLSDARTLATDSQSTPGGVLERVRRSGLRNDASATVVKAREFRLPPDHYTTASIIVGPDRNLWFTEWRNIGRITVKGELREVHLRPWQMIPGLLTVGPDGYVWANTAATFWRPPDRAWTPYQIFRISPTLGLHTFRLPENTFFFPTNLAKVDGSLYFGLTTEDTVNGSDVRSFYVSTIDDKGAIHKHFSDSSSTLDGWVEILESPGPKLWLYDFQGGIQGCSLTWHCSYTYISANFALGNVVPTMLAYSPADNDIYVSVAADETVYRIALSGKRIATFKSTDLIWGYGAIAYYRGNIWVTLGGDSQGRPMLGKLTPGGRFSEISLPFQGPAAVTALVAGPDGHLWYLRGRNVGEILSPI